MQVTHNRLHLLKCPMGAVVPSWLESVFLSKGQLIPSKLTVVSLDLGVIWGGRLRSAEGKGVVLLQGIAIWLAYR